MKKKSALIAIIACLFLGQRPGLAQEFNRRSGGGAMGPEVGAEAPEFKLRLAGSEKTLALSELKGKKPMVLFFGSYTCGPFCRGAVNLEPVHKKYQTEAKFVFVYIREAHPAEAEGSPRNPFGPGRSEFGGGGFGALPQAKTEAERHAAAVRAVAGLGLTMTTLVDDMNDSVNRAYAASPDRIYVLAANGKIAYKSERGPWGFKPEEMEKALVQLLAEQKPSGTPKTKATPAKSKELQLSPDSAGPPGVEVERNVEYGKVGGVSLKLDIYRPTQRPEQPMPVVVWIHGGGWRSGSKAISGTGRGLAPRGYCVVSIDYRLSGVAPFPAAVEDSKCAVRWLRANAEKYGVDPDRIGAWGGSAGGHLALMLGCVDEKAGLEGQGGHEGVSSRVQAVCAWFPATDFTKGHEQFESGRGAAPLAFLGGTIQEKPEGYKQASPVTHVSKDDPPTLLIHGDHDRTVPLDQSESMLRQLQTAGVEATLIRVKNAGHGFQPVGGSKMEPSLDEINRASLEFFDKHLKKRQAPR